MKAAYITATGTPDQIIYGDLPRPAAGPGQVLVKVGAVAVNPIDTYIRAGTVAMPLKFPYVIGCDLAGTVAELGPNAGRFKVGDRVWGSNQGLLGRQGTFAEYAAVDEQWLYPTPREVDDETAAAVALVGITAHLGLVQFAGLESDETLFVNGGTGGVGSMVVQMSKALGARVITTAGSDEKLALCRQYGADLAIHYQREDVDACVRQFAPQGVNVWWETLREPNFDRTFGSAVRARTDDLDGRPRIAAGISGGPVLRQGMHAARIHHVQIQPRGTAGRGRRHERLAQQWKTQAAHCPRLSAFASRRCPSAARAKHDPQSRNPDGKNRPHAVMRPPADAIASTGAKHVDAVAVKAQNRTQAAGLPQGMMWRLQGLSMAIRFFCSTCGKQFEVADSLVGQEARCKACGGMTRMPAARHAPGGALPLGKPLDSVQPQPGPAAPVQPRRIRPPARRPPPARRINRKKIDTSWSTMTCLPRLRRPPTRMSLKACRWARLSERSRVRRPVPRRAVRRRQSQRRRRQPESPCRPLAPRRSRRQKRRSWANPLSGLTHPAARPGALCPPSRCPPSPCSTSYPMSCCRTRGI